MENEKKHKLFFNVFNKVREKKAAEKQAAETPAVEEEAQEKACQCHCHCAREVKTYEKEFGTCVELLTEIRDQGKAAKEVKTYESEYRACRGALEQINTLGTLPKEKEKTTDELNCRARMEIMKSVADVILEMMEDMEAG